MLNKMTQVGAERTALGWRAHSGWAVLVVVRSPASSPQVLARRRIELVDGSLPRQPYHAIVERGLSPRAGRALINRVEKMALATATAATASVVEEYAIETVGVVGRERVVPTDLERILASHALLHAAEGDLFDRVLLEAAAQLGRPVSLVEPERLVIGRAIELAGKVLGPPWQKDHKQAAAAALETM